MPKIDHMAKEFSKPFYQSTEWKKARKSFISARKTIDGGVCQVCGDKLGFIVHHKIKLTPKNITNKEITTSFDNLLFVCKDCHDDIHYKDIHGYSKPNVFFDENGQPIDRREI